MHTSISKQRFLTHKTDPKLHLGDKKTDLYVNSQNLPTVASANATIY